MQSQSIKTFLRYGTYKRYNKPTMFMASYGICGQLDYLELQVQYHGASKTFEYTVTDGYVYKMDLRTGDSLKSIIDDFVNYIKEVRKQ